MKNKQELCRNHQKKKEKKEEKKHEYSSYTDQELKDFSSENLKKKKLDFSYQGCKNHIFLLKLNP